MKNLSGRTRFLAFGLAITLVSTAANATSCSSTWTDCDGVTHTMGWTCPDCRPAKPTNGNCRPIITYRIPGFPISLPGNCIVSLEQSCGPCAVP